MFLAFDINLATTWVKQKQKKTNEDEQTLHFNISAVFTWINLKNAAEALLKFSLSFMCLDKL